MSRTIINKNIAHAKVSIPAALSATSSRLRQAEVWAYGIQGAVLREQRADRQAGDNIARVMWSEKHITAMNSQNELTKEYHPRRELVITRYMERKDPFWWNVLSTKDVRPRVVRSWAINRTRVAFKNALKRRGYDENGRRLMEVPASQRPQKDFVGTAQFMVNQEAVKASWAEINSQADQILDGMLQKIQRGERTERKGPAKLTTKEARLDKTHQGRSSPNLGEERRAQQKRSSECHQVLPSKMTSSRPSFLDSRNVSDGRPNSKTGRAFR